MILYWNPEKLSRSMTREQWKEIDRWRRRCERTLLDQTQRVIDNLTIYGRHPRPGELDKLACPPMLIFDKCSPVPDRVWLELGAVNDV